MENRVSEGDQIERIVDVDTFVSYLEGYRSGVVATRPSSWDKHPDLKLFIKPDRPRIEVTLGPIAWQDTPQSIQQAISFQYSNASVEERRSINLKLDIPEGHLFFKLDSPSVVSGFRTDMSDGKCRSYDKCGNLVVPYHGLVLLLRDIKPNHKGDLIASKRQANPSEMKFIKSGMAEEEFGEISEERLMNAMSKMSGKPVVKEKVLVRQATLQEFQDIARILEKGKQMAEWRESLAP